MRYSALVVLASAGLSAASRQCTGTAYEEGGNWFCGAVSQILYEGFGGDGSYKDVTMMGANKECSTADKHYSGGIGPLAEELSVHFRGPIELKEFAVYNLSPSKKRSSLPQTSEHVHARRHGHAHFHNKRKQKRVDADIVTATINGQVVHWTNDWKPHENTGVPAAPAAPAAPPVEQPAVQAAPEPATEEDVNEAPAVTDKTPTAAGDWGRVAYYNAESQTSDNVVFLGNYGGSGSGLFDMVWGNSLSYLAADGQGGADSPQTLKDTYIGSNKEFSIFSAEKCDESCGYTRADDVAYKGFGGGSKAFLYRFKMPLDGDRGFNGDMSALWMLNARIPRSMQYGDCSCWETGCGEADIYEVLASGDTKCKSTFHLNNGAGSSDYFERPIDNYVKVATVFDEGSGKVSIKVLPDSFEFGSDLSEGTVHGWLNLDKSAASSLFQV